MNAVLSAGVAGLIFAIGLGVAGMTDPGKVVGFLDVAGRWDPSLAFVMAGAMGTYALARRLVLREPKPVYAEAFPTFPKPRIDPRLIGGAALFGVGWGLTGYCPGPAITSLVTGSTAALFVGGMGGGMGLFRLFENWQR